MLRLVLLLWFTISFAYGEKSLTITKINHDIEIDGQIQDSEWSTAALADNFLEVMPSENTPSITKTETFVTYDEKNLYVSFKAYDNPNLIRARQSKRDAIFSDDLVGIIIDPNNSGVMAYQFFCNPLGNQGDGQKFGQSEREDWDAVWYSAGQLTDNGYQVEMAIPFSTFRISNSDSYHFRISFFRITPRDDSRRQNAWTPFDRNNPCDICQLGHLYGVENIDTIHLIEISNKPGHYVSMDTSSIQPGQTYFLNVEAGNHAITAETTVPVSIELNSIQIDDLWDCDGNTVVDSIDLHQDENDWLTVAAAFYTGNFDLLTVDTVEYKMADCYTSSFTSMPYFALEWTSSETPPMLRTTTLALEDTVTSLIMDTSFSAIPFKGPMFKDKDGNFYCTNPTVWNFTVEEMFYGWLSFNYYGLNMILIEATDQAFADYYAGDPLQMNQYTMPNSNIEGGLGLFSSTSSTFFFVYIKPEELDT